MANKGILRGLCLVLLFSLAQGRWETHAESLEVLNQKVNLESQIESRLKQMLVPFIGTQDLVTIVRITLAEKDTAAGNAAKGGRTVRKWDENEETVLPGVPAATSMTKKTVLEEVKKDLTRMRAANMSVSIFIGKPLNQEQQDKIKQLVFNILGLDIENGDILNIETYPTASKPRQFPGLGEVLASAALIVFIVFVFGPLRSFLKTYNEAMIMRRETEAKPHAAPSEHEEKLEEPEEDHQKESGKSPVAAAVAGDDALSLSAFVNEHNLEDLKLALRDESPQIIARVIQHLPPQWAVAVIPDEQRKEIIAEFTTIVFDDPREIKKIIEKIKEKIQGSHGGATKLSRLLQLMDRDTQDGILGDLRMRSPEFASRVENKIFRFEHILRYDDQSLRRIFRKAGVETFVKCLKKCSEETTRKFYDKLGPSITNLITARLKTAVTAAEDEAYAQLEVLQAVEGLSKKGFILPIEKTRQQ